MSPSPSPRQPRSSGLARTVSGRRFSHREHHTVGRLGWLRAAVLGANDGLISTASLVIGFTSAGSHQQVLLAAGAGLVAGAFSMAAGEYVSVSSQADAEQAGLNLERQELRERPAAEEEELTQIYIERGLERELARQVAKQLMEKDALAAHARDELGLSDVQLAKPIQAAVASALSFASGAALPAALVVLIPIPNLPLAVPTFCLAGLFGLGLLGAKAGGAKPWRPAIRVTFWGAMAMACTALIGKAIGASI